MQNELLFNFEYYLYKEAERITKEVLKQRKNTEEIERHLSKQIKTNVTKDLKNYWIEIEFLVRHILRTAQKNNPKEKGLDTKEIQRMHNQLLSYCSFCKESNDKDHKKAANKIAKKLINFCHKNPNSTKSLPELIYEYMPIYFKDHYDSVDSKGIMLFLQKELQDMGYLPTSLKPFRIIQV